MPEVDILMATYNGSKFVAEQIESILTQTFQDFRLLIRDDGSTDNTQTIIEEYAAKYPNKIQVIHDNKSRRNFVKNFFELLKHSTADYAMFSDQDDVWLPDKVHVTLDAMKKAEKESPNVPVMVFAGCKVVDASLSKTYRLMTMDVSRSQYDFRCVMYYHCAQGCTQMINRLLLECMGEYSDGITIHDWWATLCASALGKIVHIPQAVILYRQHGNNVIGAGTQKLLMGGGAREIY